jgi:hypothetical protein
MVRESRGDKKQAWPAWKSAGGEARTTADLEIGATFSSIAGRRGRWTYEAQDRRLGMHTSFYFEE